MILDYTGGTSETASVLIGGGVREEAWRQKHRERGSESYVLADMKEGLTNQRMQAAPRGQRA